MRHCFWVVPAVLLSPVIAFGDEVPAVKARAFPEKDSKEAIVRKIAAVVDKHISADWSDRKITPAPQAEDAEFLRRVYLDLLGRIPKVAEVRAFEEDQEKDKREKLVAKLLQSPMFASHWATSLRIAWMPESQTDFQTMYAGQQYQDWLRKRFAENMPIDELVRKTLTAVVYLGQRGFRRNANMATEADSQELYGFYQAAMAKPENLGALTSRAFLGVKLECAQCHDHPFAPYTRTQFWEFAAFFAEFTPLPPLSPNFVGPIQPQTDKSLLQIPGTERFVSAKYLDGTTPDWNKDRSPRMELANWITSSRNPYFAKNIVNRYWHHLFGIGLIDPVDEPGENNPASHPELLNDLAKLFIEAKYDQRVLIRGLATSKAYNLTSQLTHPTQKEPRTFARMNLKGLTGLQIYDSFVVATGLRDNTPRQFQYYDSSGQQGRSFFNTLFPPLTKPTETQTSILQALAMMNSKNVAEQTSLDKSEILAAVIDAPFLDTGKKIDTLFQTALTRKPTPEEREKMTSYVDRGGVSGDKKKALSDVFWVLLNSPEFLFNK